MILATVKVDEFDRFWSVFTSDGAKQRRKHGSRGAQVLRSANDDHEVWIVFDWSEDDYEGFLGDPATRDVMAAAGLQGPPRHTVVEQVGRTDS
jgi:hypothetical protein